MVVQTGGDDGACGVDDARSVTVAHGGCMPVPSDWASCRSNREISAALGVLEAWEANKTSVGFRNASTLLRTASNEQHWP